MKPAGYSGTPLEKKLGIVNGANVRLLFQPAHYFDLFTRFPDDVQLSEGAASKKDLIHLFVKNEQELYDHLPGLVNEMKSNGCIWVSWPKKSSRLFKDLTEDKIRDLALRSGLVDVKVCAIDPDWSGLKLVIPVKNRKSEA